MRIGDLEVVPLVDGVFRLDGGAMFGVVPKPLWSRRAPADDKNRITLGLRPIVVRTAGRTVLIDAGIGSKFGPKELAIYGVDRTPDLDRSLAAAGLDRGAIDLVVASHLHFDHAGGFTERVGDRLRPAFPRARYVIRRGEWEDALHTHERNRASYLADDFVPLAEAGVVDFLDADGVVAPGIRVERTGGHTPHHQVIYLESGGRTGVFAADLMPTAAHVDLPWILGDDLHPMDTLAYKRRFLREAIAGEYVIFFEHDPAIAAGIIRERDGRLTVEAIANAMPKSATSAKSAKSHD
jgi:glyoxylase-like metal-dependent hydrolase (beta-lactamase superfamily II)